MSKKNFAAFAVVCCFITIALVTVLSVRLTISAQESCSADMFDDIVPNIFTIKEQFFTTRSRLKIYDAQDQEIGSFTTVPSLTKTVYSFRDKQDQVVAQATKSAFSWTYRIGRCKGATIGPAYELERIFFTFGSIEYNLRKNGVLIGNPAKKTLFTCRPDVVIESPNGTLLATASRSCLGSLLIDTWKMTNYGDEIENYALGFIAYITTQQENSADAKSSNSKKN